MKTEETSLSQLRWSGSTPGRHKGRGSSKERREDDGSQTLMKRKWSEKTLMKRKWSEKTLMKRKWSEKRAKKIAERLHFSNCPRPLAANILTGFNSECGLLHPGSSVSRMDATAVPHTVVDL
ncbi:hypothetical protein EYF80_059647 [Liparis tanakae]|uniref:Uncharacterized protein n=1 Tax=Liparis tanakae TaxID=230148 RepID=A0A4Z2EPB0_9TELE|nr:hypothetical protein EYF80_059647 [Liparis tanakae]